MTVRLSRLGFMIPEFPQQTHIAWWRVSEGMRLAGVDVQLLSTRRPTHPCPHPQLRSAAETTMYLWPPEPTDAVVLLDLLRRTPAVAQYLLSLEAVHGPKERLKTLAFVAAALRLLRIARERNLEHVFVHSCADAAHVVSLCHLLGGPKYTLRLGGDLEVYGGDHRAKMERATLIVPAARSYEPRLVQEIGLQPNRVMWSWVGTDTSLFKPADVGPTGDVLQLITVARLNPAKGYQYMIPAVAELARNGISCRYRIVGAGPFEADIRRLVTEQGVEGSVELLGSQSTDKIAELLAQSHVFVLPTSGIGEGTPAAVCEAMSAGLAIVATAVGGIADMITEEEHGLIVPPGDSSALASALGRLAKERASLERMGKASRAKAIAEYDSRAVAKRILDKIETLEG